MDYWSSVLDELKNSTDDVMALEAKMLDIGCPDRIVNCLLNTETK